MSISPGSDVNGYIIKRLIAHYRGYDVFEVVDKYGQLMYLKMFSDREKTLDDMLENSGERQVDLRSFSWGDKFCYVHDEQDRDFDYFNVELQQAGTIRKKHYGDKIVRTPMPFDLLSDYEDDDEDDDDGDDDEDDEDDSDDDEGDDDDGEIEERDTDKQDLDCQIFFDDCSSKSYTFDTTDTKVDMPSILLHSSDSLPKDQVSGPNCHVEIETPKCKRQHKIKHIPRTPIPPTIQAPDLEKDFEKSQDQSKCNFELKMVASAMLKRREAKSLAI